MKYLYYPGCTLEGSAMEYDVATRAFLGSLGVDLLELQDWTCCGASAAEAVSPLLSLALPARNLAIAEKEQEIGDLVVPCSACYLNLRKVAEKIRTDSELRGVLNTILANEGLSLTGRVRVRHLLDVLSVDIGPAMIGAKVTAPLDGLRIAPYYGCQCLRPYAVFDDPEKPRSMEPLIRATGAEVFAWDMGGRCCGASHMNTKQEVALQLVAGILGDARGADAVVTVCPMCQMNLEAYQKQASHAAGKDLAITILYLPQLLGLAVGLNEAALRLDLNLAVSKKFREGISSGRPGLPQTAAAAP
jgi:heterodisulfide reductase subunit B